MTLEPGTLVEIRYNHYVYHVHDDTYGAYGTYPITEGDDLPVHIRSGSRGLVVSSHPNDSIHVVDVADLGVYFNNQQLVAVPILNFCLRLVPPLVQLADTAE